MSIEQQYEASEFDGAKFGRMENTGVVLGLGLEQVFFLGIGVVVLVPTVLEVGFPANIVAGLFVAGIFVGLGVPRVQGRSLLGWVWSFLQGLFRRMIGQHESVPPIDAGTTTADYGDGGLIELPEPSPPSEIDYLRVDAPLGDENEGTFDKKGRIKPPRGARMYLPGEFDELQMFQLPHGAAFIYDPKSKEGMISAEIRTERAFDLESFERKEDRTRQWANVQSAISRIRGIARVQCSDQTTMVSGERMMEWYDRKRAEAPWREDPVTGERVQLSGPGIDPWLHQSLVDLMNQAEGQPVHKLWLTVVLDRVVLQKQIRANGGRLRGFMATAMQIMESIDHAVPGSGAEVVRWHSPRSLSGLIRTAFDPESSTEISKRTDDFEGVAPSSAGPMLGRRADREYVTENAVHRTFWISEWPQSQAVLGFLDNFVFVGDFRHTVSLYIVPRKAKRAYKEVADRKSTWATNDSLRERFGRPPSQRHDKQREDVEHEESELVQGHAPLKLVCVITVSAMTDDELEAYCQDLETAAAQATCEIRPMTGQQDSGFMASATPLGRLEV